jgi:alanyl-tRNA synthetase
MTSPEIRQSFLDFFASRGHRIVPSAPVIPHGDPTLLFTNAGMNQFKDVFLGTGRRDYVRAADTQKCIRVSGKHNDLEEVGRDTYHHTFFEMLGNWSFGDYYKAEAIGWAWELLTGVWGLEKKRLYATVFETDEEAEKLWTKVTDIHPSHVLHFGKKDNFWEMGETGPCGPCSEIHIDLTPDYSGGHLVNAGDARVMEIWNLVFIQNNRNDRGELESLPAKHVDTGMGFERVCAVLQGKSSNYDTDVFMPVIDSIARAVGTPYTGRVDSPSDIAMRVIADHIRMLSFSIADGAIPGNDGRGYVLRRILRRAARFGRNLGMKEPFIYTIAGALGECMGKAFPEVLDKQEHIRKVIRAEEESFNLTLDRGLEIFESVLARSGARTFPGDEAFKLYDTFGFPLDLTQLMASERGVDVDTAHFSVLMEQQRSRARDSDRMKSSASSADISGKFAEFGDVRFVGYGQVEAPAVLERVVDGKFISLDQTPFYVESGGQVDDTGVIEGDAFAAEVLDSFKSDRKIVHEVKLLRGSFVPGAHVTARVDRPRRANIQRNHSATHLVHEALRRVLGTHVHQQGSLVAPDHLRFDFPHFGKLTPDEIRAIEEIVNGKIAENIAVETGVDMPIEKAKKIPNVKMFFGDKYGDIVRVVIIDEKYSVEFCGGTHVANTKEIGLFKIISEAGIASGVRRIEAVTGDGLRRYIEDQWKRAGELHDQLGKLQEEKYALEKELGAFTGSTPPPLPVRERLALPSTVAMTREALDTAAAAVAGMDSAVENATHTTLDLRKELSRLRVRQGAGAIDSLVAAGVSVDGVTLAAARVEAASMDELKSLGDTLRAKLGSGVGILAAVNEGKISLVCVVTDDLIKGRKLSAGKIVGAIAKEVGGGGGGAPHLATAGGKEVAKLDGALASAAGILRTMLG